MVRAAVAVVTAVLLAGACSGQSTSDSDSHGNEKGGSSSSGTAGATSGTSGSSTGGTASGGFSGTSPTGGAAGTAGKSTGGSSTGGSSTGGDAGVGGTGGGGTSGDSGAAGEGGAAGCEGPAPGGCPARKCADGQTCVLTSGVCSPSQCECVDGNWACTDDCGGGRCIDGKDFCTTPDPSGCGSNADCPDGDVCMPSPLAVCIPRLCACNALGNTWTCREECTGGVCVRPSCPTGCTPQMGGLCGSDRITWVCTSSPFPSEEFRNGGCTDAGTQVPRYCCPTTFKPECL